VEEEDGSATVWVGTVEQIYRMSWQIGIRLRPGISLIETEVRVGEAGIEAVYVSGQARLVSQGRVMLN
jgi:hypothetical protein